MNDPLKLAAWMLAVMSLFIGQQALAEDMSEAPAQPEMVSQIEQAHGYDTWIDQQALQADVSLNFYGGKVTLDATMLFTPSLGQVRMTLADGTVIVYNEGDAWITPSEVDMPMARFHVLTWPYFLAMPFKLSDPGVFYQDAGVMPLTQDVSQPAIMMSFAPGTGDSPDDWYFLFTDAQDRLSDVSYIVTYGTDKAEAEEKPSVARYSDFVTVDGVTLAQTMTFYFWSPYTGADTSQETKGTATFSNFEFVTPEADAFDKPADAKELAAP